ncbi:MAG: hypothetical protein J4F42_13285 [Desulfurellaceae bacterium]|nr:hypothetical protein [Desulfurellaceae bacterium]
MAQRSYERLRIRRAKRTDIPALRLLAAPAGAELVSRAETRYWRRLASDPRLDFYIAEQAGAVQGMLLVCYVRTLGSPGWQALLDLIVRPAAAPDIVQALLGFAKARARRRGCQQLLVQSDRADRQLLTQNGFAATGPLFACSLD